MPIRRRRAATPATQSTAEAVGDVVEFDQWTEPLTSRDATPSRQDDRWAANPFDWLMPPTRSGSGPVIADWVQAAILAEPAVLAWRTDHRDALDAAAPTASDTAPAQLTPVATIVAALFAAEGGATTVTEVVDECAAAYRRENERQPPREMVVHPLPDGIRLSLAVSESQMRTPLATLCYATSDGPGLLTVLRDARLGALVALADTIAERYLLPASEVVSCILTGAPPQISPVRLGLRYRRFQVDGVPVTASSRIAFEVDPQLEPGDLARTLANWQHANNVVPCHAEPVLTALAGKLIGRLRPQPARETRPQPPDTLSPTLRNRAATRRPAWTVEGGETNSDPRLNNSRKTAAIVRILTPFDSPHRPRWLPMH
jgi:hypothetical protein